MTGIAPDPNAPSSAETPAPPQPWTATRVLALIAGALLLYYAAKITRGIGFASLLGVLLYIRVQQARARAATRTGAWLASCAASVAGLAMLAAFALSRLPPGELRTIADSMRAQQQRTPPPVLPPALQRLQPSDSASRAAQQAVQRQTTAVMESPVGLGIMMFVGGGMACLIIGAILGTAMWGAALLLARGWAGVWTLPPPLPGDD